MPLFSIIKIMIYWHYEKNINKFQVQGILWHDKQTKKKKLVLDYQTHYASNPQLKSLDHQFSCFPLHQPSKLR